jgi:hypothetical protein
MHKLVQLEKIIEERIGSLREEVEIATNVRLNPLYIADRRDEIQFLQWTIRHIRSILNQVNQQEQEKLGETKQRQELEDIVEFENILGERIQELNLRLKDSDTLRASDILINEIDTLECVLGHLSDLKYGDMTMAIEIAEAKKNFNQAKLLREELCNIHDTESKIAAQMQNQNQ